MKRIHPFTHKKTSVSMHQSSYRRLCAARKIFARHGIHYSDQEIYRRLFKHFLKNWRGRGPKSNGLRRYNARRSDYEIHPLYINQVLYGALWQRALHSGESISRMLDFAIRVYLPRLLEEILRSEGNSRENANYWESRYQRRKRQYSDFFINYSCTTRESTSNRLEYLQETQIIAKAGLSPMQIWDLHLKAA